MHRRPALTFALFATLLHAQTKPEPDVLVFTNGDKLAGQFERATGSSVTFKSDMVGEITVDWSKISEVHSSHSFAVIPKNVTFKRHGVKPAVPEGAIALSGPNITVTPAQGAPATVAVADSARIIEDTAFQKALTREPGFFRDWKGAITAGASLVQATQESRTFTGAISLARIEPVDDWLTRQNRTTFDFSGSYGTISQPGTPEVKTDIFHLGVERDEYFSSAFFGFGEGLLDHNFSQNLSLQQTYGGGIGWSVVRRANQSLDLKAGMTYIHQQFTHAGSNQSLAAALFEEDYKRTLGHGMTLTEQAIINPALNNTNALSGHASTLLTMPVYKRINSTLGISDSYLHDPPPGFKKNSFQFTAGLTYAVQ